MKGERLLLVDDDEVYLGRLAYSLQQAGHEVCLAHRGDEALRLAGEFLPTAAVLDLRMPGMDGLECLRELKAVFPDLKVVILTGYGSIANALKAVRAGAMDYLTKPADAEQVLRALAPTVDHPDDGAGESIHAPSLDRLEWEHIQRVIEDCDGNITHAAAALGLHRRTLQRKIQRFPPRS
ncbi:response regulator [Verrucomicrobiaceae bacterium 227]